MGARARREDDARATRPGGRLARVPFAVPPRVRPVLGPRPGRGHPGDAPHLRLGLPALRQRLARAGATSTCRSSPTCSRSCRTKNRPIIDTICSAVGHGMLSRFPGVRLATIENGSTWISILRDNLLDAYGKLPAGVRRAPARRRWPASCGSRRSGRTRSSRSSTSIGVDHVLFNSDWPHPEGLADPNSYIEFCQGGEHRRRRHREDHGHEHVRAHGRLTGRRLGLRWWRVRGSRAG